jgi:O-acetyl-ADP-ribose deacetylase (regulator of RNase III)
MHGEPTKGYQLIRNYPSCVTNALVETERLNKTYFTGMRPNPCRGKLKSIMFPLLGTRENRTDPHDVAYNLVLAATNYLEDHPQSAIQTVYFLAFTDVDKALCENAFRRNDWTAA